MLTGASHADAAVLVVAADEGIKEQTGRHAFLIHMLGIKQLSVLVNKMDLVDYSQEVFETIKPIDSDAATIDEIVEELRTTKIAESSDRAQDKEKAFTMQKLRALGYM